MDENENPCYECAIECCPIKKILQFPFKKYVKYRKKKRQIKIDENWLEVIQDCPDISLIPNLTLKDKKWIIKYFQKHGHLNILSIPIRFKIYKQQMGNIPIDINYTLSNKNLDGKRIYFDVNMAIDYFLQLQGSVGKETYHESEKGRDITFNIRNKNNNVNEEEIIIYQNAKFDIFVFSDYKFNINLDSPIGISGFIPYIHICTGYIVPELESALECGLEYYDLGVTPGVTQIKYRTAYNVRKENDYKIIKEKYNFLDILDLINNINIELSEI